MSDTATVLARPAVTVEIKRLIVRAMRDGGISQTHATRVGLAMADRIFGGEPVTEAIALVDAVLKDARAGALEEAANLFTFGNRAHACMTGDCPHDGWSECVDAIRAEITALYQPVAPVARENGGAGEAGGLLNVDDRPTMFGSEAGQRPPCEYSGTRARRHLTVKCEGGECDGLTVKIDPMPIVYEVVDPRDRSRRDFYVLQPPSADGPAKLVVSS